MSREKIYLEDVARILDRAPHTVRQWVKDSERVLRLTGELGSDCLSRDLWPSREGGRSKMFWTDGQLDGLKEFAGAREKRRGWSNVHA